ncbi:cysteine hydrolase family protein [Streptomyces johnsoniae]|uniref:Cysteine hydrolase n=1 Tax=Streptomyces johnsoniae TaxID=3075532 RepID=A0ABU2SDJ7_9ACTN|nr:cysteine hydrolase [Streptomyces sp. DSM 41886]MDT0447054.1 cysteine hydrolase [Streptomyces sp. DSM 41886]
MTPRTGTALVIIDMQNDFCAAPAAARAPAVTTNTARAIDLARGRGTEVVFVRFTGDVAHQRPSWRHRDRLLGKQPKCREGTPGAAFHERTAPAPGERVFTKRACFDAFLSEGFEDHLRGRGVEHLVLAGLFTDVCVDSTARTAFQKGFHLTVLTDCTVSLHLPDEEILRFMGLVYGARTTTHDREDAWARPEEAAWPASSAASG